VPERGPPVGARGGVFARGYGISQRSTRGRFHKPLGGRHRKLSLVRKRARPWSGHRPGKPTRCRPRGTSSIHREKPPPSSSRLLPEFRTSSKPPHEFEWLGSRAGPARERARKGRSCGRPSPHIARAKALYWARTTHLVGGKPRAVMVLSSLIHRLPSSSSARPSARISTPSGLHGLCPQTPFSFLRAQRRNSRSFVLHERLTPPRVRVHVSGGTLPKIHRRRQRADETKWDRSVDLGAIDRNGALITRPNMDVEGSP